MIIQFIFERLLDLLMGILSLLPTVNLTGIGTILLELENGFKFINYIFGSDLPFILAIGFAMYVMEPSWFFIIWILRKIPGLT